MSQIEAVLSLTGTTTLTVPVYTAQYDGYVMAGSYAASGATDGTKTLQLKNNTQAVNLTNALTISGVSALAPTAFVPASTNALVKKGDEVVAIYTVSVAGTVAPGEVAVSLTLQDPIGFGNIGG